MFGFNGRLIEALVFVQSVELIGDEREMRVELLICCVLEERSREGDTVVETVEISFQLFALLGQSIEFLFGLVFELLKENLFVLFDLLFGLSLELIGGGDDVISLGEGRGLDVGFHQVDEMEGCFDVLASILNSVDQDEGLISLFSPFL